MDNSLDIDDFFVRISKQRQNNRSSLRPQSCQLMELNRAYNSGKLVLILGAGVSKGCGMPDWKGLLDKTRKDLIHKQDYSLEQEIFFEKIFLRLFNRNNLILARNIYYRSYFGHNDHKTMIFEELVRRALYSDVKRICSRTLKEIIRLSLNENGKKLLDCIITYNYDDILECCLENFPQKIYTSIYSSEPIDNIDNEIIPIYHVHGFLPQTSKITDKNKIILGEEDYHSLYNSENEWSNKIQLKKFANNKCLFLGISLDDPNLRRLLDLAKKMRRSDDEFHTIIKLRENKKDYENTLKKLLDSEADILDEKVANNLNLEETAERMREKDEQFFEDDALSLGVQTIWAENKNDIAKKKCNK